MYRVLALQLRRDALHALKEHNRLHVSDLAEMLHKNPLSNADIEVTLHHRDLPLMLSTGVIEQTPTDEVRLTPLGRSVVQADATVRKEIGHTMYESSAD